MPTSDTSAGFVERSLLVVKPDGLRRGLVGEILRRVEVPGLKIIGIKLTRLDRDFAEHHYRREDIAARHGEAIWRQLVDYITEGPVLAVLVEGVGAIAVLRKICGTTEPATSPVGTIRGDFCHQTYALCNSVGKAVRNLVHASASLEDAKHEVALWFADAEVFSYSRSDSHEHLLD